MIVVYLFLLVCIIIYYISRPTPNRKREYPVAKAGGVDRLSPLTSKINDLSNKSFKYNGENVDIKDYEVFIVDGESMSKCRIHTGNGVLVSRLFDKENLKNGQVIIYEIDSKRYLYDHPEADPEKAQHGFKIRQFLDYVDLGNDNDTIYEKVRKIDDDLNENKYRELFFQKLDKARCYIGDQKVIISLTYKNGSDKDYSVHTLSELYGEVKFIIPEEIIRN